MRDMAKSTSESPAATKPTRLVRLRPWVQGAFLLVWLAPLGRFLSRYPSCVFHCYACPLASLSCPIGLAANFAAWHLFPFLAAGAVLLVAGLVGSLVCGWACPFGFLQDLLARIPVPKLGLPNWTGYGRYLVLLGLVVLVPYLWGEAHPLFICRVCPAGAVEAALPRTVMGQIGVSATVQPSAVKWAILTAFAVAAVIFYRPWCKVLCPLGGFLALLNRVSLFHLRFDRQKCTECNTCRARCPMGVHLERRLNDGGCIRCLDCTTCGAITPVMALPGRRPKSSQP